MDFNFINNRKIRLGFIGCGRVFESHINAINQNSEDIELISVCDINPGLLKEISDKYKVKTYTNLKEMVDENKLDIVAIATPNGAHYKDAMFLIQNNIHVIVEKPMAINVTEGQNLLNESLRHKVFLFIVHQNRFNPTVQFLHKAISECRFGKIYMVISNIFWRREQNYYDKKNSSWHGTKNMDGGAFFTQASHYIDLMHWIVDQDVKSVYGNIKTLERSIETEDTGSAIIEWGNGTIGSVNLTILSYPENLEGSITVLGRDGTVRIGGIALNEIITWKFSDTRDYDKIVTESNYNTESVYGSGHIPYYKNVINTLMGKEKPLVDAKEGINSLKIINAIYESSLKQSVINF